MGNHRTFWQKIGWLWCKVCRYHAIHDIWEFGSGESRMKTYCVCCGEPITRHITNGDMRDSSGRVLRNLKVRKKGR